MRLNIDHCTQYQFNAPTGFGLQQLRLTPKSRAGQQQVLSWDITVEGGDKQLYYHDHHDNVVDLVSFPAGVQQLTIHCRGEVELLDESGIVGPHRGYMPLWAFLRPTEATQAGSGVQKLLAELGRDFESEIARAHALSALILQQLPYAIGVTGPDTTAEMALQGAGGVCQDHSHIFITAMRQLGHPARYVSGYLKMDGQDQQDATHAWAEAYFEHVGWVGFDVSNGHSPDRRYARVATGLDYQDAAPVRGMRYGVGGETLKVALQVQQ